MYLFDKKSKYKLTCGFAIFDDKLVLLNIIDILGNAPIGRAQREPQSYVGLARVGQSQTILARLPVTCEPPSVLLPVVR